MKNNYQRIHFAAAFFLLLCLSACYESRFPLDDSPQAPLDNDLLADWRCLLARPEADEAAFTLTIGVARDGVYAVQFQAIDEEPEDYEAHAIVIDELPILNITELHSKYWVFGRYQLLQPNVLQVQIVDDAAMDGQYDTPEALRQAIVRRLHNPQLFSDLCICVRTHKLYGITHLPRRGQRFWQSLEQPE